MSKEPNQAIYDELFKTSLALGFDTYPYLPPEVSYPFVYFGEQFGNPLEVKSNVLAGKNRLSIHLYGEHDDRRALTDMSQKLVNEAKKLRQADIYSVGYVSSNTRTLLDNSSAQTLWHIVIEIEFEYLGGC
ncbi:hypothetical protein [Ligilactobacillus apodemi]|uniref:Uncharacterized protein n=1 Tax=Ligilactobacillus apodemi DSM 16634 = JCM 16172 TaxID=1423724 RepID=A0A0R1U0E6_9LACO|nr:hypothetical protein [Ligilactobacillus apodemi]KRL84616.1 hypothetical protein FC32_GL000513 [Ligilactobacillus apodemi DSM 16634 = JCM 16172]